MKNDFLDPVGNYRKYRNIDKHHDFIMPTLYLYHVFIYEKLSFAIGFKKKIIIFQFFFKVISSIFFTKMAIKSSFC